MPLTTRRLYVHAFQSFVWNHLASARLKELDSRRPVVGDLVLVDAAEPLETIAPEEEGGEGEAAEPEDGVRALCGRRSPQRPERPSRNGSVRRRLRRRRRPRRRRTRTWPAS